MLNQVLQRFPHTIGLAMCILMSVLVRPLHAQELRINEFLASNVRDYPEMYDFGDYQDWIELYNPGISEVNLSGYFLSDDAAEPLKWSIPASASIPAQSYLLIWADGYDEGPGQFYQRATWPWEDYTTRHFHTNFKLSKSGEQLVLARADQSSTVDLIPQGSTWKYLDDGSDQNNAWIEIDFDDSNWNQGAAELGYGDGDEQTVVGYGLDSDNKYITTYFRLNFTVTDASTYDNLLITLKRDDGAIVYLNGIEQKRSNMPDGDVNFETEASTAVSSGEEDAFFEYTLNSDDLLSGENLMAVEIHQISGSSSDLSFDFGLQGISYTPAEIIDQVSFNQQLTDVSQGRYETTWTFFGEPTPGHENQGPMANPPEFSADVTATHASGFYTGTQNITLTTNPSTAQIFYSLDGSRPGSNSSLYSQPLTIDATTVIKSRALEEGKLPGEILTITCLLDEPNHIPTISMVAEPPTLWDTDIGIYENEYKQREIPVTIEYFTEDMNPAFTVNTGARLGGMNIWTKPQKPFTIYTRDRFGDDFISYQLFEYKTVTDFSRIVFRNGGDDWEETLIRDPMTQSLVTGMMECGYMAYQPAALFLNGQYWGIHNIREKFDKTYFFENFGADPASYNHLEYAATPSGTRLLTVEGDFEAYNALLAFIQTNDLDQPQTYDELKEKMNVDGFIDHLVMTIYCANTSWGHNREWWHPGTDAGKWEWLIVDVDRGFNPANINNNLVDNLMDGYLLFQYLLEGQYFEERFLQRAAAHLNSTFTYERIESIVDSLATNISLEMPRHIQRWGSEGSVSSMSYWESELEAMKSFAQARPEIVFTQLNSEFNLDGTIDISLNIIPEGAGKIVINNVPVLNPDQNQTYFKDAPISLRAAATPGYEFVGWLGVSDSSRIDFNCANDQTFTAQFQLSDELILPGIISANTQLDNTQPYAVTEDLFIPAGVTLTLEPGVEFRLSDNANIVVAGQLLANGTLDQPVQIKANTRAGVTNWGGLSFSNTTDTSRITHTHFRGATRGVDPIQHRGAISAINSNLYLDYVDIRDVPFPLYIEGGWSFVSNSSFRSESICDFINVKRGVTRIDSCFFYGSDAPDTDAIDLDGVSDGIVSNNRIYNFLGANSDGIDIGEGSDGVLLTSNLIYHSSDKGISVGQGSSITIDRNLIVGCVLAVAIKDEASAIVTNNSIINNHYGVACYEKNEGAGGGTATVTNTILSGSLIESISVDEYSSIEVSYSLSDLELLPGTTNIVADPQFVDSDIYNFELTSTSPCLNAGNPGFPLDEDGSISDIGAYYTFNSSDYPFFVVAPYSSQIKLNEFMASNSTINQDEAGDFDDWVELYNPVEFSLNLAGLYLTDNPNNLTKWQFPEDAPSIEPYGHLLVWCDDEMAQGDLHTNFKLSAGGEFLALVNSDGLTVFDSLSFRAQREDISFGRIFDGGETWASMVPSPGMSNTTLETSSGSDLPQHFKLHHNFPNPFNPVTTITYEIPTRSMVKLSIYDMRGRSIRTLINKEMTAGYKSSQWDATDEQGKAVEAGIYLYSIHSPGYRQTKKLVLLK